MNVKTFYFKDDKLFVLNQKLLPHKIEYVICENHKDVAKAIKDMIVRGAPAIGCVAAYGFYLGSIEKKLDSAQKVKNHLIEVGNHLISSRPTAVNLSWAVERMAEKVKSVGLKVGEAKYINRDRVFSLILGRPGRPARSILRWKSAQTPHHDKNYMSEANKIKKIQRELLKEADKISQEDIQMNKKIGEFGAKLLKKSSNVLTHCNAGTLATAGYGTALGIIRSAFAKGKIKSVFVDETRPHLQGARLTAWELAQEKIPYFLITDNMAGYFMSKGAIDAVIVGADRITANGDTANKIGTYSLAVLANYHKIPFYVAAPSSTIDYLKKRGKEIPIEERSADEVIYINGKSIAPTKTKALHPAFDVTSSKLISAIITQKGVFRPPYNFNKEIAKII